MSNDLIKYEVEEAFEKEPFEYKPTIQSADTLFHFVDKLEYLLSIIEKSAIIPRYCTEDVDYLDIGMKQIAYPMLCFCDINLHKMQEHIEFYGGYGIAFSKIWGISKGIQPIQYVNPDSILKKDFSIAFQKSIDMETTDSAQNYLLSQMYYFKAIQGTMERNGETVLKNFTDECEWRYIPDVASIGMPQAITEEEIYSKNTCNDALAISENCWLRFNFGDVKYIILKDTSDFKLVSESIRHKGFDENVADEIISKIMVWSEIRGDL